MRLPAAVCLMALIVSSAAAQPASWGLPVLMQSMAGVHSATASFTETRILPMLNTPLQASGTLAYVAPDTIRKTTTAPVRQDFILQRGEITISGGPGNQTHRFSLRQDPAIGGLTEAIRGTLAGDLPSLENNYRVTLSGSAPNWQLLLTPKDADLRHFVAWIAIRGDGNRIYLIDTAGADGSKSDMQVTETTVDAR